MLARRVLQQRLEDLHGDVGRQQRGEDLLLAGLVLIDGAVEAPILSAFGCHFLFAVLLLRLGRREGDELLRRDDLRDCRAEFGVDQRADVELAGLEHGDDRSEEHTSELQSLMRISYAVFCLKKKKT